MLPVGAGDSSACLSGARFATRCRGATLEFGSNGLLVVTDHDSGWLQRLFPATAWSSAAMPSNSAPRVDAASGGASMTTLPLGARRTWSWREELVALRPRTGSGGHGRDCESRLRVRMALSVAAAQSGTVEAAATTLRLHGGGLILRLVGRLDQLVERIGDRRRRCPSSLESRS